MSPVPENEVSTFARARRQQALSRLAGLMRDDGNSELVTLDEVQERLASFHQSYVGFRAIPVDNIVGSVDRSGEFDRAFRPRSSREQQRWRRVEMAFPEGDFPPIAAYKAGDVYLVSDGHHRVGIARQRGMASIDAEVTEIHTPYELTADIDVAGLIHMQQALTFLEESGLGEARPEARIEFSRPEGYPELLEVVRVHGYRLMQERRQVLSPSEVAADWYDHSYAPAVKSLHEEGLNEIFSWKTDGDLFLFIYQRRRKLSALRGGMGYREAALAVKEERDLQPHRPSRRELRDIERRRELSPRRRS